MKRHALVMVALSLGFAMACGAGAGQDEIVSMEAPGRSDMNQVDELAMLLLPYDAALVFGDTSIATSHAESIEQRRAEALRTCLENAGLSEVEVDDLVMEGTGRVEVVDANVLSREHVVDHGFGLTTDLPTLDRSPGGPFGEDDGMPSDSLGDGGLRSPEMAETISRCEEAAAEEVLTMLSDRTSADLLAHHQVRAEADALEATAQLDAAWRECIAERGYQVRDVEELITSLALDERSEEQALAVERSAALDSFECSGSEDGLRRYFTARFEAARRVAETIAPADAQALLETFGN